MSNAHNNPEEKSNPLPPLVFAVLIVLALIAGIVTLGNQAGWWSLDF